MTTKMLDKIRTDRIFKEVVYNFEIKSYSPIGKQTGLKNLNMT